MKRILSIAIVATFIFNISNAQSEFDLIKFVQPEINGTARYTSMAGAFGALGGDASAIKDNPAGLGIYRSSEITGSFNLNMQNTQSQWLSGNKIFGDTYTPLFNNFNFVMSFPASSFAGSNLKYSNISFSANRLKNFNRSIRINGGAGATSSLTDYLAYFSSGIPEDHLYTDTGYDPYDWDDIPWMSALAANTGLIFFDDSPNANDWRSLLKDNETVSPSFNLREDGYLNEYAFSWAGNFNNKLFVGLTFNIYDLYYRSYSEYSELFSEGGDLLLQNNFSTDASGLGFKLGTIYTPLNNLRLGFALQTPVFYTVSDSHYADVYSSYEGASGPVNYDDKTPYGSNKYKIQGPLSYNFSGAYIIGKKGIVAGELALSHNNRSKFMDLDRDSWDYTYENDNFRDMFTFQKMVKLGGEFKITDNFAVRGGYAIANATILPQLGKTFPLNTIRTDVEYFVPSSYTQYLTAGIGYRQAHWFLDLAVVNKNYSENFYPYNSTNLNQAYANQAGNIKTNDLNIVTTLGIRF